MSLLFGMQLCLDHKEDQGRGALPQTAASGADQVPRGACVSEVVKVQPGGADEDDDVARRKRIKASREQMRRSVSVKYG